MAANGISTLATKEARQRAKLDLAATKRAADGNARSTYDLTLLPTQYDGDTVIDNPNTGGLVLGRPWISTVADFVFYEAFTTTVAIETTQYVSGNNIYVYSSTLDVPNYENSRVIVNDIEVLNVGDRGHNMVVLDPNGNVISINNYDTWAAPGDTALATALNNVTTGNIVVLSVWDASALNSTVRNVLNSQYGSTNTNTWDSQRIGHIFIGIKS